MKKNNVYITSLWELFITFAKIGAFTFGGGYAMLSIVEREVVEKKHWMTPAEMLDMLVIAESTPGVIAINTATSVGYRTRGVLGAIIATMGIVVPAFVIIFALSFAIEALGDNKWYLAAFAGIQVCVIVLILNAFVKLFSQLHRGIFEYIVMIVAFAVALLTNFNVVFVIVSGAVAGIIYRLVKDKKSVKNTPLPINIETKGEDGDE